MTYTEALPGAVIIGVIALLLPAIWIAWWLLGDLGESIGGGRPRAT